MSEIHACRYSLGPSKCIAYARPYASKKIDEKPYFAAYSAEQTTCCGRNHLHMVWYVLWVKKRHLILIASVRRCEVQAGAKCLRVCEHSYCTCNFCSCVVATRKVSESWLAIADNASTYARHGQLYVISLWFNLWSKTMRGQDGGLSE